jgi:hypothetical protein
MNTVILEGKALVTFLEWMDSIVQWQSDVLRVAIDVDGVKFKADAGTWSPGIGE